MTTTIGTDFAYTAEGEKITYEEADRRQRAEVADPTTAEVWQYVDGNGRNITTWSGGVLMKVTYFGKARTGWYGSEVYYVRATAPDGSHWYGKNGGPGMIIRLKRAKH